VSVSKYSSDKLVWNWPKGSKSYWGWTDTNTAWL